MKRAAAEPKQLEVIGDRMYLQPLLFLSTTENPFKAEKREFPVDFGFPIEDKYNFTIAIPDGFAVETMPAHLVAEAETAFESFRFIIGQEGNNIQLSVTKLISKAVIQPNDYPMLKLFYKKMIDKQLEKIVLKKVRI